MKINISNNKKEFLTDKMFGLFFEDINYAGDGGLNAEMIENRQFAFVKAVQGVAEKTYDATYAGDYGWNQYPEGADSASMKFIKGGALNETNPHYMRFQVDGAEASFTNKAYDGICMKAGKSYLLTMWIRSDEYAENVAIKALDPTGEKEIASVMVAINPTNKWEKYEAVLEASCDVKNGIFVLSQKKGSLDYAYISLMPKDAIAGVLRADLVEMLKELRPGFLRFPGGCIVEGATLENRYRWKNTVGDNWDRAWNYSRWAVHDVTMGQGEPKFFPFYNQSFGIGFYEYFLLSEILGAKALPVLSVGLACQFQSDELVPIDSEEFKEYLQDAIDLIEFANGDESTTWGAVRSKMGHPEPFGLEYIGIGNEQWETERVDFFARYKAFEEAVHAVYPEIKLLGSAGPDVISEKYTSAWDFYRKECANNPDFTVAVDEHYYMPPNWFYENTHMYDDYSRDIPVFAGEYAAHCDKKQNNLEAALAEAAFMCGLERNGDVIRFASVAPLFCRKGYEQWIPDFIWFDGDTVMGTPGYYVQKLFGAYTGHAANEYSVDGAGQNMYFSVSSDDEKLYVKVINSGEECEEVCLCIEDKEVSLQDARVYQMNGESPDVENVLGGETPVILTQTDVINNKVSIPAYSCTVIIVGNCK